MFSRSFLIPVLALVAALPIVSRGAVADAKSETAQTLEPFLQEHCVRCHGEKKQKGEFRVDKLSRDFISGADAGHWADVMERISSGDMPPEKEPQPKAADSAKLVEWLAAKLKEVEGARLAKRDRVTFNKLSREEYVNTIRDLLGVTYDATDPSGLSEDEDWRGFERIGSVLSLSPSHVEKYFAAAETILGEAFPEKPKQAPKPFYIFKDGIDLRTGNRAELEAQGVAHRVRVEMWPGHDLTRCSTGSLPSAGIYKMRVQLSGLKPKNGRAPHLAVYATNLDRMLFEQDILAPEDKPTLVEFTTHLPQRGAEIRLSNDVPGPSNLPRSGRAGNKPFLSIKEGRIPWQIKLTDEEGSPLYPFLIVDWIEWSGPIVDDSGTTFAQREYMPSDASKMREALEKFATRAFRRPPTAAELDGLTRLAAREMESGETLQSAFKTALVAVLCDKSFLYLVEGSETSNTQRLTDWELASRLSYSLWSTMPDAALFEAAKNGTLHQPEVLRAQVARMLADERSARFSEAFPRQWLQLKKVGMFPPDKKLYPDYDSYLEKSMKGESTAFFREVLQKNLTLREFITSDWTMVNARLAFHYQMPGVTEDRFQRVSLRPEDHRGGLLTQAAVLSLTSDGTRHRPVHRGKWVLESIIGKPPPPPPANVKPIEPTPATGKKVTLRMKLDAHKTDANCAACHAKIDPLGLAFDNYDAIGRWRTEEIVSDGSGENPKVDASGELIDGRKFSDAESFKKLMLGDLDKFNAAFIEKLATFALRRATNIDDRAALSDLAHKAKAADYRVGDIVQAVVTSDLFQKR